MFKNNNLVNCFSCNTTAKIVPENIEAITCRHLPSQFRDDNKKLHPCLVDFQSLPEPERNYNLQMSGETLKYVSAETEALHRLHWTSQCGGHAC